MTLGAEDPDPKGTAAGSVLSMLRSTLDAIHKEDDRIGGRAVTRLTAPLSDTETSCIEVLSTIGFGELNDGATDGRVLIGGEVIEYKGRNSNTPFGFESLLRGQLNTEVKAHPVGTLVLDFAQNTSAIDRLRRGFLVNFAIGEDLEILARNLGLKLCPGVDQDALRRIIKAMAYLPKTTEDAFRQVLTALYDDADAFSITERTISSPFTVFVEIDVTPSTDIRGRFLLNSGENRITNGLTSLVTDYPINHVLGVYLNTPLTRRGHRDGFTNFFSGGSFVGSTITLGSSPGPIGTPVLVDYGAFEAHYLATDETTRQDTNNADRWAYLADPLLSARCLLEEIKMAGVRVVLSTSL